VDAMLARATVRPWAVREPWSILTVAREAVPVATSKRLPRAELQRIIDDERAKRLRSGRAEEAAARPRTAGAGAQTPASNSTERARRGSSCCALSGWFA